MHAEPVEIRPTEAERIALAYRIAAGGDVWAALVCAIEDALAPYLLLAELGAVLFGGTAASAEERITLEIIGAVRMTGPAMVRPADAAPARSEDTQAREASAERSTERMAARHN